MDLQLKSRTAVVSGASIGIGRAIARALAREGARVVAVARRRDLLEQLAQEVRSEGTGVVIPVVQDIMQQDATKELAAPRSPNWVTWIFWSTTPAAAGRCRSMRPTAPGMRRSN
jgi:NADP-dependent 3-hydroxy acid dehydrogenase YdfG